MTQTSDIPAPKLTRGRPKGAAPKRVADIKLLRTVAKDILDSPDLPLTTALRRRGVTSETDLTRLRRRWRSEGIDWIGEERADRHYKSNANGFQKFVFGLIGLTQRAREVMQTIDLDGVVSTLGEMAKTKRALENHGGLLEIPFDSASEEEVAKAVARLELRDRKVGRQIVREVDEPGYEKDWRESYAMAVVMHERALAQRRYELAQKTKGDGNDADSSEHSS